MHKMGLWPVSDRATPTHCVSNARMFNNKTKCIHAMHAAETSLFRLVANRIRNHGMAR